MSFPNLLPLRFVKHRSHENPELELVETVLINHLKMKVEKSRELDFPFDSMKLIC